METRNGQTERRVSAFERLKTFTALEPYDRWVRGIVGTDPEEIIIDSKNAMLLWRDRYFYPVYCFKTEDVQMGKLKPSNRKQSSPQFGEMLYYDLVTDGKTVNDAAWQYTNPPEPWSDLKGYILFDWNAMDRWFEETEQVFVHPRDPYHRVDVVPSSRNVKVVVGGTVVAGSDHAMFLFETGLPTRYYIPEQDVRVDLLEATDLKTRCPYKGVASYRSMRINDRVYENIVWSYPNPIEECPKIKGLLCFYNEKVDAIYIDGEEVPKPVTPWS